VNYIFKTSKKTSELASKF